MGTSACSYFGRPSSSYENPSRNLRAELARNQYAESRPQQSRSFKLCGMLQHLPRPDIGAINAKKYTAQRGAYEQNRYYSHRLEPLFLVKYS